MKNTKFKKIIVACVATFAFLGLQIEPASAKNIEDDNRDLIVKSEQQDDTNTKDAEQNNHRENDWINIEEMLQRENHPVVIAMTSLIPITTSLVAEEIVPATETEVQEAEGEIVAPVQEPVQPVISISEEEKDLFSRLVEAEAKGESYEGKVAVATVVLNRVDSPEFPNTIIGVINEVVGTSYAFSPVQNGEINQPASDESKLAVEEALTRTDRLNDCIYFYNPDIATDSWIRTREVVKTIDHHVFAK